MTYPHQTKNVFRSTSIKSQLLLLVKPHFATVLSFNALVNTLIIVLNILYNFQKKNKHYILKTIVVLVNTSFMLVFNPI